MIPENNKSNSVSSADVRNNFKNNKKNRHIGLKISVFLGIILIGIFFYFLFIKFSNQKPENLKASDSTIVDKVTPPIIQNPKDTIASDTTSYQVTPIIELSATGSTPNELRENLKLVSSSYMMNKQYTPVSCKIYSNIKKVTFKLEKKSSRFTKLSLCFGSFDNSTSSCESCVNVLTKNIGSIELNSRKSSNNFIYKVIAIAE